MCNYEVHTYIFLKQNALKKGLFLLKQNKKGCNKIVENGAVWQGLRPRGKVYPMHWLSKYQVWKGPDLKVA